jgi:hypothetical protein
MTTVCKKRRWFQFGLRPFMLVPVLVAAVWWWSTWPERTARRFVHYLAAGDVAAARNMMRNSTPSELESLWKVSEKGESLFIAPLMKSRSRADWLYSRGEFNVDADQQSLRTYFGSFIASRGSVRPNSELAPKQLTVFRTRNLSGEIALGRIRAEFNSNAPARIIVDPKANGLIVHASQKTQDELQLLLKRLDQEADSSVRTSK